MKAVLLFLVVCACACSVNPYSGVPEKYHTLIEQALSKAGENRTELEKALLEAPKKEKEGMAFLIAYMPDRDLQELSAAFLLENTEYAYKAREKYSWAQALPDSIFLNEVLPYVSLNETRENWRKDFYERFGQYVDTCHNLQEAIEAVNRHIRDEVGVDYNTLREKPDQAPFESIRQQMASCTGLSILLTDAFRAVGIPSRVAGTPNWHDGRGNHNWTEVWMDGKWFFTEYYFPGQLDQAWFFADAGQASKDDPQKAIYASSFRPTGISFPLVWDRNIQYVPAENVTERYNELYASHLSAITTGGNHVPVRVSMFATNQCTRTSDSRVAVNVDVFCGKMQMGGGRTSGPLQDMNDVLTFMLEKNKTYTICYTDGKDQAKRVEVQVETQPKDVNLYMQ